MEEQNNKKKTCSKPLTLAFGIAAGVLLASTITLGCVSISINNNLNTVKTENSELSTQLENANTVIDVLIDQVNTYTVTYTADGKVVYTTAVKYGKDVESVPAVPEKKGYDGSWSSEGKEIKSDTVIFAVYTPKTYTITYHLNYTESLFMSANYEGPEFSISQNQLYFNVKKWIDIVENTFVFKGKTLKFNNERTELLNENDEHLEDIYDGDFYYYGFSFHIEDETSLYYQENDISYSVTPIIKFDGYTFYASIKDRTVINLDTNEKVADLKYFSMSHFMYSDIEKLVIDVDDDSKTYPVVDNYFTPEGATKPYYLDANNLNCFSKSNSESKWKTNKVDPKLTYTYGEDVLLKYEVLTSIQNIYEVDGEIIAISEEDAMDYRRPQSFFVIGEEHFAMEEVKYDDLIHNPIGNLDIYVTYGPKLS